MLAQRMAHVIRTSLLRRPRPINARFYRSSPLYHAFAQLSIATRSFCVIF